MTQEARGQMSRARPRSRGWRCTSYFRGRGIFRYKARRCELPIDHDGQHVTASNTLDPQHHHTWGRTKEDHDVRI